MDHFEGKVNKAIVYAEPGTTNTKVIELPIQAPRPGQVLVRMLYSGVCHTDYSFCTNAWKFVPSTVEGQIGGHEGIGKVVAHGQGVSSPPIGTHVGIKYISSACLTCKYCLMGAETDCISAAISGYFTPGTFQQYCLAPANYVTPIPDSVHEDELPGFAPLMCAGLAVYTGIKRGEVRGGNVAVSGAGGGLGHLAIQYAKALGARVIALDVGNKEKLCKEVGADVFIDVTTFEKDDGLCRHVKELTGGGVQVAIGCSSSHQAYAQAVGMLDVRGTLVCLGLPEGEDLPMQGVRLGAMIQQELKIIAVKAGNWLDAIETVNIAASGKVKTRYQLKKMEELTQVS
jgi:propanol-preferring alcohol dehydrogenase